MKKWVLSILICCSLSIMVTKVRGQCSICARTAQQLGEKPAKGLNAGIIYLAFMPITIIGFIGYRWWKSNQVET